MEWQRNRANGENQKHDCLFQELQIKFDNYDCSLKFTKIIHKRLDINNFLIANR